MQTKEHWETVYTTKVATAVSWFQEHAENSLKLIQQTGVPLTAAIIDIGGGASTLVDDLLSKNYSNLSVLDLSTAALRVAQNRLGDKAKNVNWITADITNAELSTQQYDVWHDRAVFHFLTTAQERQAYVRAVLQSVKPGGHVIVATFAEDGPLQCSGLPVMRYNPKQLHTEFGEHFLLVHHEKESHQTPLGTAQQFTYCYCRKISG